jgi:hypothetical protein
VFLLAKFEKPDTGLSRTTIPAANGDFFFAELPAGTPIALSKNIA